MENYIEGKFGLTARKSEIPKGGGAGNFWGKKG